MPKAREYALRLFREERGSLEQLSQIEKVTGSAQ